MKLEEINKENIFKTPDGYFDSFPEKLQKRMKEDAESKISHRKIHLIYQLAAAAAILVFATFALINYNNNHKSAEALLADVSSEALIEYLVSSDLSEDELLDNLDFSLLSDEDLDIGNYLLIPEKIEENLLEEMIDEYEIETTYL